MSSPVPIPASADKNALRRALREARRSLSAAQQRNAAENLLERLLILDAFQRAKRIALYLPNDGEIDPSGLIAWCKDNRRSTYLPVVRQADGVNSLLFAPVTPDTSFENNRFGIPEPVVSPDSLIAATELDLVLLPLVGFDCQGNRIGMGGGFYDRTFSFIRTEPGQGEADNVPVLVGLAHGIQQVDRIDAESWDVPLSTVVTDQGILDLGAGQ